MTGCLLNQFLSVIHLRQVFFFYYLFALVYTPEI